MQSQFLLDSEAQESIHKTKLDFNQYLNYLSTQRSRMATLDEDEPLVEQTKRKLKGYSLTIAKRNRQHSVLRAEKDNAKKEFIHRINDLVS